MKHLRFSLVVLFAAALVLALAGQSFAEETKGKVKALQTDKNTFTMTDNNNKDATFHLADNCKILINDRESKLNDLKVGDQLTVTWREIDNRQVASKIECKRSE